MLSALSDDYSPVSPCAAIETSSQSRHVSRRAVYVAAMRSIKPRPRISREGGSSESTRCRMALDVAAGSPK